MRFQGFAHLFRISKLSQSIVVKCSYSTSVQPRVAIVGSGPAGMFACNALLRRTNASIDVFDAAPVPFGLIRYGVAPDHQEVKNCIHGFDKMFESNRERLSLFCNVRVGIDISFQDLISNYDAVLLAYGAHRPKRLNIPGADAFNVFAGSDFVSWYNGVPKATKPILSVKNVVIVGNGNVALDCARIICNGKNAGLRATDVPIECIEELERSTVENIKIIGRRGPLDISFTVKELREQFKIPHWDTIAEIDECQVGEIRKQMAEMTRQKSRLIKVLLDGVTEGKYQRQCRFLFNRIPTSIEKDQSGHVTAIRIMNKEKNIEETLECGLLIYSIGYQTIVLEGVPKNKEGMIDMIDPFRVRKTVQDKADVYAVGWCAHGAKGVIVDSQLQSTIVAEEIAKDLDLRHTSKKGVKEILHTKRVPYLNWDQWKQIDKEEQVRGQEKGKVREKLIQFDKYIPQ